MTQSIDASIMQYMLDFGITVSSIDAKSNTINVKVNKLVRLDLTSKQKVDIVKKFMTSHGMYGVNIKYRTVGAENISPEIRARAPYITVKRYK